MEPLLTPTEQRSLNWILIKEKIVSLNERFEDDDLTAYDAWDILRDWFIMMRFFD